MSHYPVQKARFYVTNTKGFVSGGPADKIIIISQTEPLQKDTNLQLFTISECTSGDQLYYKIEAATTQFTP
jgi:hypothetical protein